MQISYPNVKTPRVALEKSRKFIDYTPSLVTYVRTFLTLIRTALALNVFK